MCPLYVSPDLSSTSYGKASFVERRSAFHDKHLFKEKETSSCDRTHHRLALSGIEERQRELDIQNRSSMVSSMTCRPHNRPSCQPTILISRFLKVSTEVMPVTCRLFLRGSKLEMYRISTSSSSLSSHLGCWLPIGWSSHVTSPKVRATSISRTTIHHHPLHYHFLYNHTCLPLHN